MSDLSKSLENLLKKTYRDKKVSMEEYSALRHEADVRWESVISELGQTSTLVAFQNSLDVTMHLLYLSLRDIQDEELSDVGEAIVKDAVMAQIEYLRAGAKLTLDMLKVGRNNP